MIRRYFIYFSYNGRAYHGWQIQPNGISVQEVLTKALQVILHSDEINLTGAGRTDAGVHARLMVAHFDLKEGISDKKNLIQRLNRFLPSDIAIHDIAEVKTDAHARFSAVSRKYEYHIICSKHVFFNELAVLESSKLDFELMNHASSILLSYDDFTSFSKLHTDVKTNNCNLKQAFWTQENERWIFVIEADRFLRNMVRAIVGTLLEVGRHKIDLDRFRKIIELKNRSEAGASVPAHGLYLVDIQYPDDIYIEACKADN